MVCRTAPTDNLSGGCVIAATASVQSNRPTSCRRSISVPHQAPGTPINPGAPAKDFPAGRTRRHSDVNGEFTPVIHKKMTGPMPRKEYCSRRKSITEESQQQLANASFSSRLSNTSLTGSCRRSAQRSASVDASPKPTAPFATAENASESTGIQTPRPISRRVSQTWSGDSGKIIADGSQNTTPSGGSDHGGSIRPETARVSTGRKRAASSSTARSTDFARTTSQVFDISTDLKTKKRIPVPGTSGADSARPVFQQPAEQPNFRPAMRQKPNIKPVGTNDLPMKAKPSKRMGTSIGKGFSGALGAAGASTTAAAAQTRGRKMVDNHTVSEESPRIVRIWAKSGRKPLDAPRRDDPKIGKRQFSRTESAPIAPTSSSP